MHNPKSNGTGQIIIEMHRPKALVEDEEELVILHRDKHHRKADVRTSWRVRRISAACLFACEFVISQACEGRLTDFQDRMEVEPMYCAEQVRHYYLHVIFACGIHTAQHVNAHLFPCLISAWLGACCFQSQTVCLHIAACSDR